MSGAEAGDPVFEPREVTLRDGRVVFIRSGLPDDAQALLDYMRGCLPDISPYVAMDVDEFTHTEESEHQWLAQQLETCGALVVLALDGERIVGITNCSCNASRRRIAHIGHVGMSADQSYWGSGVGSAMLSSMIEWAERHPILELLELDVFADNTRAASLYRKLGFVEVGRVPGRAKFDDGSRKEGILMYRDVKGGIQ